MPASGNMEVCELEVRVKVSRDSCPEGGSIGLGSGEITSLTVGGDFPAGELVGSV
jgi:hypothetical protein